MPTHKITNEFIRKYNKQFAIKGYSKMSVSEKVKTIQNYVGKPGMSGMKRDWKAIMGKYRGYGGRAVYRSWPGSAVNREPRGRLVGMLCSSCRCLGVDAHECTSS